MTAKLKAHLYCTAALAVFMSSGVAFAQADDEMIETVVVTGQRAAIESAITIKEKADVIVDSVAAEDIGKLPDNSITEVLQRLPGVNITRIQAGGSSENYLGEGTGVTIRGLTSTVSLLNGRDSFSAANGRNLAWEDIPPELMQGVDVYKSLSAALPEGGFGGVVNLRTRQPFDFEGMAINATLTGNYADWSRKGHLGGVGMFSNRWMTGIGEIGLLVNVAYSNLSTKADGVQVLPYTPTVNNMSYINSHSDSTPSLSDDGSELVYVPGGIGFTRRSDGRVRFGLYAAAQWHASDNLLLFLTAFNSRYTMNSTTYGMAMGSGVLSFIGPDSTNTFDDDGNLTYTSGLSGFMWGFSGIGLNNPGAWGYEPIPYTLQTQYSHAVNSTTDISLGGEWQASENLSVNFALQYIDSTAKQDDNAAVFSVFMSGYGLNLTSYGDATLPSIEIADDTVDLASGANYMWTATMPHKMHNYGRELAAYVDGIYNLSDEGFFRKVRGGLKITYRNERDNESTWNYKSLSPWWVSPNYYLSEDTSYGTLLDLSDLFEGQVNLPSAMYFPSVAAARNPVELQSLYGVEGYSDDEILAGFTPYTLAKLSESTITGYVMADFAKDDFIVPFKGNIGFRVVAYRDHASGYHWSPPLDNSSLDANNSLSITSEAVPTAVEGGHSQIDILPSVNVQFQPTDELKVRLGFSQAVSRPTFAQMIPRGYVNGSYNGTYTSYFGGSWGNPDLKPEKAEQLDASFEYYFKSGGEFHISVFWKNIHNFISTRQAEITTVFDATVESGSVSASTYCVASGSGVQCSVPTSVTEYFNETEAAQVDGFEIGLRKYADFLPKPFNGFGVDINYTYIDSSQPGAEAYDLIPGSTDEVTTGRKITGLPVTGLSKNTVNFAVMYDMDPLSVRVAYNWRDDFLVSTAAWQTSGTYNNVNGINYGSSSQQGQVVTFSLPVYAYPSGTLDASLSYNLTDNVSWTFQASNLTREVTRLYMDEGTTDSGGRRLLNRSWYMADTRYTTQLRLKF